MKALTIKSVLLLFGFLATFETAAQIVISNPKRTAERQVENRANRRVDRTIDKGLDKIEEGIGNIFKKKDKNPPKQEKNDGRKEDRDATESNGGQMSGGDVGSPSDGAANAAKPAFKSYSKFDFIPGEKIVASEDFSQDAVGDFPAKWNTNSTAEVVTIDGLPGKWLMFQKTDGSFIPDFVKDLPENFTLEFDFVYNGVDKGYVYSQNLYTAFHEVENSDLKIDQEAAGRGAVFKISTGTSGRSGQSLIQLSQTDKSGRATELQGERSMSEVFNSNNNGQVFHVAMWRQKQRLRVYFEEEKVFDLPRIFPTDIKMNAMRFNCVLSRPEDQFFISNIRLAVGAPDTRSKLMTEGKFVTTGITFDVNSANIKPASYAVLKDIAATLTENPAVKVKIIGHTDSDGDDAANLTLSKKRAESVKENLASQFGIDKSRLETDGKGESVPAVPNTTPEGKANNRRVEFVKM